MNDNDLTRLFAEEALIGNDDVFVAAVTTKIVWRKRRAAAIPLALAALLVAAIWATWPAAYVYSADVLSGVAMLGNTIGDVANSLAGRIVTVTLLVTGLAWSWLYERVAARD